jgi:hypothetical protein
LLRLIFAAAASAVKPDRSGSFGLASSSASVGALLTV